MSTTKTILGIEATDAQIEAWEKYSTPELRELTFKKSVFGDILSVDSTGLRHGIIISAPGDVNFINKGSTHRTDGPAYITHDSKRYYYLWGINIPEDIFSEVVQVRDLTIYYNSVKHYTDTGALESPYLNDEDIRQLKDTWVWNHPNRNYILKQLILIATEQGLGSSVIVKCIQTKNEAQTVRYTNESRNVLIPLTTFINPEPLVAQYRDVILKYIPDYADPTKWGTDIFPNGSLRITSEAYKQSLLINAEGNIYNHCAGQLHSLDHERPAVLFPSGSKQHYIHGRYLSDDKSERYFKYGQYVNLQLGLPPAGSDIYQLCVNDIAYLEGKATFDLPAANALSNHIFNSPRYTMDILKNLSLSQISQLGALPPQEALDRLIEIIDGGSTILESVAGAISTSIINSIFTKEGKHVTV